MTKEEYSDENFYLESSLSEEDRIHLEQVAAEVFERAKKEQAYIDSLEGEEKVSYLEKREKERIEAATRFIMYGIGGP